MKSSIKWIAIRNELSFEQMFSNQKKVRVLTQFKLPLKWFQNRVNAKMWMRNIGVDYAREPFNLYCTLSISKRGRISAMKNTIGVQFIRRIHTYGKAHLRFNNHHFVRFLAFAPKYSLCRHLFFHYEIIQKNTHQTSLFSSILCAYK